MQISRFGLRNDVSADECQLPFNIAHSRPVGVTRAIDESFSGLQDNTKYSIIKATDGVNQAYHAYYSMAFNHECEPDLFENGFSRIVDIYMNRANRFINTCHVGRRCFVFIPVAPGDVTALAAVLRRKTKDDLYRLIALDHRPEPTHETPDECTRVLHIPYPTPTYFWVNNHNSAEGVAFDIEVRDAVQRVMEEIAR